MESVKLGSRVYYNDQGPEDTGTIVDIILDDRGPFIVKWDRELPSEEKEIEVNILDQTWIHQFNPSDENIDGFRASQLTLIKY